jgi:hypothetical protein
MAPSNRLETGFDADSLKCVVELASAEVALKEVFSASLDAERIEVYAAMQHAQRRARARADPYPLRSTGPTAVTATKLREERVASASRLESPCQRGHDRPAQLPIRASARAILSITSSTARSLP